MVSPLKKNPWNRALRVDKLTLAALEATLCAYEAGDALTTVPTLRKLTEPAVSVRSRAQAVLRRLSPETRRRLGAAVVESSAQVGGGALPTREIPSFAVAVGATPEAARALESGLRAGQPAVIGRIAEDRLLLDCRTVLPSQVRPLAAALTTAAARGGA
jgi:L-seryl-tRNA(Ser) seleniumtransferase